MLFSLFFPLIIGSFGVLQNTINRKIATTMGLPLALVINNLILLACSILLFFILRFAPAGWAPDIFREKNGLSAFTWVHFLPGLFGFFIIAIAPWAIERAGATRVFIGIIVAQIVVSLLWDFYVESMPVSPSRFAGAALALAGAFLAIR